VGARSLLSNALPGKDVLQVLKLARDQFDSAGLELRRAQWGQRGPDPHQALFIVVFFLKKI
jgi:hypothetical protein